jgi:hypothetical protein
MRNFEKLITGPDEVGRCIHILILRSLSVKSNVINTKQTLIPTQTMVSRRSDLFLRSLFTTLRGAPAASDDESEDELGAWMATAIPVDSPSSNWRRAASVPVAASAKVRAADDGDRGESIRGGPDDVTIAEVGTIASRQISDVTDSGDRRARIGASEAESRGDRGCEKKTVATKRKIPAEEGQGSGPPRKQRQKCRHEACTNIVVQGGVCIKHGAKVKTRGTCRHDGCTNYVQKGGVCMKHGAKRKKCRHDGCTNLAQKGGICFKHGAKRKKCRRSLKHAVPMDQRC